MPISDIITSYDAKNSSCPVPLQRVYQELKTLALHLIRTDHNNPSNFGWIAGGACRTIVANHFMREEHINDIDIYFNDQSVFDRTLNHIKNTSAFQAEIKVDAPHVLALQTGFGYIDLVKIIHKDPASCIDGFHFTAAACAVDVDGKIYCADSFIDDVQNQVLKLMPRPTFDKPISTLLAALKYSNKGYKMNPADAADLIKYLTDFDNEKISANLVALQHFNKY